MRLIIMDYRGINKPLFDNLLKGRLKQKIKDIEKCEIIQDNMRKYKYLFPARFIMYKKVQDQELYYRQFMKDQL